ncbi:MAG TPA: hypothetical protein VHA33_10310 [Candidatus Angelobacter sp.]|nr:hypothetical protein [Candidatus Angelobacter sp.]
MAEHDDLLEKGFALAHFIFPHRPTAISILMRAMNKLETQRGQESKRNYWRDKYLKRWITRVNRNDSDTLQWLIYFESDSFEKQQEQSDEHTAKDLVVRYIKNLVRMTTAMSSFHVNIGLHRILHNYSTGEVQKTYEFMTERYLGADEYRRAKSVLMTKLEDRFGKYLQSVKTAHGEVRFEASPDQRRWVSLVRECLTAFTPWSTMGGCLIPESLGPATGHLCHLLSGQGHEKLKQDKIEINRCHALIDPICHGRLIKALGFDPPDEKLALPRFLMETDKTDTNPGQPSPTSRLTKEELTSIRDSLSEEAALRQNASPSVLRVLVDHQERAIIDLDHESQTQFEIQEGAELIEIWAHDRGKELLLASQLIGYTEGQGMAPVTSRISIRGRKKLILSITPAPGTQEVRSATVSLACFSDDSTAWGKEGSRSWRWFGPVPKFALASAALVALGWYVSASMYRHELSAQRASYEKINQELARERAALASATKPSENVVPKQDPQAVPVLSYMLMGDDVVTRGPGGPAQPTVVVPDRPALVDLKLPIGREAHPFYRAVLKPFLEEKEILSENLLRAQPTAAGPVILFTVPTIFLAHNQDYMVILRYVTSKGKLEELNSFTFHVSKSKK